MRIGIRSRRIAIALRFDLEHCAAAVRSPFESCSIKIARRGARQNGRPRSIYAPGKAIDYVLKPFAARRPKLENNSVTILAAAGSDAVKISGGVPHHSALGIASVCSSVEGPQGAEFPVRTRGRLE